MTRLSWAGLVACMLGAASPLVCAQEQLAGQPSGEARAVPATLLLRVPSDAPVAWRGVASFDTAGSGAGAMMYPGMAGVIGFLAAVAVHGVLVEHSKNSQKSRLQEEADQVLAPLRPVLDQHSHRDLLERAAKVLPPRFSATSVTMDAAAPAAAWVFEGLPTFSMTQDRHAIVLDQAISASGPAPANPRLAVRIRVVSAPYEGDDPVAHWLAEDGLALKQESGRLVAHAVEAVMRLSETGPSAAASAQKTIRYLLGTEQKMERGTLVSEDCSRTLVLTLRGDYLSVPRRLALLPPDVAAACAGSMSGPTPPSPPLSTSALVRATGSP